LANVTVKVIGRFTERWNAIQGKLPERNFAPIHRQQDRCGIPNGMIDAGMDIIMHSFLRLVRAICAMAVINVCATSLQGAGEVKGSDARKSARLNCGAKVECSMPESARHSGQSSVVVMSDDSISCPLSEGDTTFVVALPASGAIEHLKFVNDNPAARGTLRIAVANQALAPNSARWTPVDGDVSFRQKRLFNLSVVGVEAKFVRVTFSVERETHELTLALRNFQPAKRDLFSAYFNAVSTKQTAFSDNFATANAPPLFAGLSP
jgi:hypothetical protein